MRRALLRLLYIGFHKVSKSPKCKFINPYMPDATLKNQAPHPGVTFRAIALGLLLIPVNTYFIMANHLKFWSTLPTTMSLIYNVIITLMVLIPFNLLLKRFLPKFAFRQAELLTVFAMLSLSSAIAGHDMMQTVIPTISDGYWFATPENEWKTTLLAIPATMAYL